MAVAVGVVGEAHGGVGGRVIKQTACPRDQPLGVGADQLNRAGCHRLRPLGGVAGDQHRLAERGRLLLHAAGIGDDQRGAPHQLNEGQIVERWRSGGSPDGRRAGRGRPAARSD